MGAQTLAHTIDTSWKEIGAAPCMIEADTDGVMVTFSDTEPETEAAYLMVSYNMGRSIACSIEGKVWARVAHGASRVVVVSSA